MPAIDKQALTESNTLAYPAQTLTREGNSGKMKGCMYALLFAGGHGGASKGYNDEDE